MYFHYIAATFQTLFPQVFCHADGTKRQWVSYSPSKDALFCVPCILFSYAALRGQHLRPNQGIAFTPVGFRSCTKQHGLVLQQISNHTIYHVLCFHITTQTASNHIKFNNICTHCWHQIIMFLFLSTYAMLCHKSI